MALCKHLEVLLLSFLTSLAHSQKTTEYCNGEVIEAGCGKNEVIVFTSALYGRMQLGRCVKRDRGNLGCNNDAMTEVDKTCSGKTSCQLTVSNRFREDVAGACEEDLAGFVEVDYSCVEVLAITAQQCSGGDVYVTSETAAIASTWIDEACLSSRHLNIMADPGQTLNLTLWSFDRQERQSYGSIQDAVSDKSASLQNDVRFQHVISTIGHSAEITFEQYSSDSNFLIGIKVIGCADMSPPEGAWMTRDGDVMEIGCHAGSKSWSLRCENNQWTGVLGQCGTNQHSGNHDHIKQEKRIWTLSLNVFVFGLCSFVIMASACIFMAAVFILKRKMSSVRRDTSATAQQTLPLMATLEMNSMSRNQRDQCARVWMHGNTLPLYSSPTDAGEYKSLQKSYGRQLSYASGAAAKVRSKSTSSDCSQYINSTQSDKSESVKYYVLEDITQESVTQV